MCSAWEARVELELSEDQKLLMAALDGLLAPYRSAPTGGHAYVEYSEALRQALAEGGFLEIAGQDGFGPLEAAMLIEAVASCPVSAEVAASTLMAPLLGIGGASLAIAWAIDRPVRYLDRAGTVCLFCEDGVLVGTPAPEDIRVERSVVAYPLATLRRVPGGAVRHPPEVADALRRRALIGIAAEAAGLMRGALDQTVQYVKDRHQFGQPLAQFQAIQHRLAEDAQLVHACRLLAFRAAWADNMRQASLACLYAQQAARKLIYDCHQFSGAMGLTLEYPLHLWTYRLKYLQGEAGGRGEQARVLADEVWGGSR
jgi:alkylation response protein AidB-like acyl-CoA dehydrogenase